MINPDKTARREGYYWVSDFNFRPEVVEKFEWPKPLEFVDSTLRKTLFTAGTVTSMAGFERIAEALVETGIRHESLNVNWAGGSYPIPREWELCQTIAKRDWGFKLNVYADAFLPHGGVPQMVSPHEAAERVVELGARVLAPGIVETATLDEQKRQMDDLADFVEFARGLGAEVTITLAQVGRRDFDRLVEVSNRAAELGVRRLDLMDSTSSLSPDAMRAFVLAYRAALVGAPTVTMHAHDDFGLGTATTIAAVGAGAWPDASIAGVSYRAGFAPLEEVAVSLEVLYGVETGIRLEKLQPLADLVAAEMGLPIPPLKPLVGKYAFLKHMPGDVAACLNNGLDAFPPVSSCVSPGVIGSEMSWVWDSLTTDAMARALGRSLGAEMSDGDVAAVRKALDDQVAARGSYPRWLTAEEATEICRGVLDGRGVRSDVGGAAADGGDAR